MFKGHYLYYYIVPIVNNSALDTILREVGILTNKITSNGKGKCYGKIFPIHNGKMLGDDLAQLLNLEK